MLRQGQTEIFEYHWSYMMTGNRLGDLLPTSFRLLRRPVWKVPAGMRFLRVLARLLLIGLVVTLVVLKRNGVIFEEFTVAGVLKSVAASSAIVAAVTAVAGWLSSWFTSSFVDVVRYLDTSPRSYEARRAIRGGMVELLRASQDDGPYSRVVVVAHSLGAYIAYDAITSLWTENVPDDRNTQQRKRIRRRRLPRRDQVAGSRGPAPCHRTGSGVVWDRCDAARQEVWCVRKGCWGC